MSVNSEVGAEAQVYGTKSSVCSDPSAVPYCPRGPCVALRRHTAPLRAHLKRPSQKLKHQCVSAFSIPHLSVFLSYCLFAQTSRAVVHSSLSYNRESETTKAPPLVNPRVSFYTVLQSSCLPVTYSLRKPGKAPWEGH